MADRRRPALLALNIAGGLSREDADAEALALAAFADLEEAAEAYAYLTGFLLQALADTAYDGSVGRAAAAVRSLIVGRP